MSEAKVENIDFEIDSLVTKITASITELKAKPESFENGEALLAEVKAFAAKFLGDKGAGVITADNFNADYQAPFAALRHKIGLAKSEEAQQSQEDRLADLLG